jgi:MFS family permease
MSNENKSKFTAIQIRFLIALGCVIGLQTLSMTMLNSFIDIYGETLKGNTSFLCGLALGVYGLTNAAFQIPYGSLSDRTGRKPVILAGLAMLSIGLFIGFLASNIYLLILSRALQGSGAIQGLTYSWINDGVEDDKKSRAMSIAGIIVAIGGVGAFVGGPLLYNIMSVRYMFLICSALILVTFLSILFFIKEEKHPGKTQMIPFIKQMQSLLSNKKIIFLSLCGFTNNYIFTVVFLVVPKEVKTLIGAGNMWMVFLPAILIGIVAMKVSATFSDKGYYALVAILSFLLTLVGWIFLFSNGIAYVTIGTILNMTGFMCLTAGIPSQVNKLVAQEMRGAANGILQSFTYLGIFFGPTIAGYLIGIRFDSFVNLISILLALLACILSEFCELPSEKETVIQNIVGK